MKNIESEIELVAYSPVWQEYFKKECQILSKILRNNVVEVHHIGSTAIPKVLAKPTLDILCVVHSMEGIELFKYEFQKFGLTWIGESGVSGRIHFIRLGKDGKTELCHLHIMKKGNPLINDFLDFRDYLNSEDKVAKEYEKLKILLKEKHQESPHIYQAAKNEFFESVLRNLR